MRKLIYSANTSLDGYIEDVNGDFGFAEPSDEIHLFWNQWIRDSGATLLGRRTYEAMEPYWSDLAKTPSGEEVSDDFARAWVETPLNVVSRTLESVPEDHNLINGDLENEVKMLKGTSGGPIDVGGAGLADSLAKLGLIDELMMVVYPVPVGAGKANLGPSFADTKWNLLEQSKFSSGAVLLRYELQP